MEKLKPVEAKDRIILALDVETVEDVIKYVELLKDYVGFFKVGLPLITSCGFEAIDIIKEHGGKVYFDGKFFDIPDTIAKACINLLKRNIDFFNISSVGGSKMLANAVSLCRNYAKKNNIEPPVILAVTLLSSFGQKTLTNELGVDMNISSYVFKLSQIAKDAGLSGVVAPDTDASKIKKELGDDFIVVCPAVRPTWAIVNDQIRIVSPSDAIKAGADYIIIGRPITHSSDPVSAAKLIINEVEDAVKNKEENL
ncbi:MAG: orotidine-5'-phosphate decarboxylase [Candidatus Gastranaerophilales bacterium]|nr:orotidine-5'-phosphate decarboxylase [Candidatus Gastranaerophilales bacterium]